MVAFGYVLTVIASYLLGSIPTGFLVARCQGVDIFAQGSGNMGATNVFRVLGKPAGILVLGCDFAKGWAACRGISFLAAQLLPALAGLDETRRTLLMVLAGLASILGHNYPCWLRFRGGKGIATSAGVLAGLLPVAFAIMLGVWILVALSTRYVSVASLAAAAFLPVTVWALDRNGLLVGVAILMAAIAIFKHRGNIQRLMKGTEHRFGTKKQRKPEETPG